MGAEVGFLRLRLSDGQQLPIQGETLGELKDATSEQAVRFIDWSAELKHLVAAVG